MKEKFALRLAIPLVLKTDIVFSLFHTNNLMSDVNCSLQLCIITLGIIQCIGRYDS